MRERWTWRGAFVVAAIGSAVGLGNIWRFPYVVYNSGGGAFLIPFLVALLTAGIPLMMLEFTLGKRFAGAAPLAMKRAGRAFEFVGWWAVFAGFGIITYYAAILAWSLRYLWGAFTLEWGADAGTYLYDKVLQLMPVLNAGAYGSLFGISTPLIAGFILSWLAIFFIVYSGIKGVGKVVMITMPLPFILIIILMIRGITLPGAAAGLNFYLKPNFAALANYQVWLAAYGQVFFSLSLAMGILIAYASYLPKDADISNNSLMTTSMDALTAFIAGIAVFSTTGYMAAQLGVPVQDAVASGPGLAFVAFPEAINMMPFAPALIGVIFFITIFTLGIDSAFSLTEGVVAAVMDKFNLSRKFTSILISGLAFLVGLVFISRGGLLWLDQVDYFLNNFVLVLVGLLTCLVIGWGYGAHKIREHINEVSEIKIGIWFDICIKFITPIILIILLVLNLRERILAPYEGYPAFMQIIGGWGMLAVIIILGIVFMFIKTKETPQDEEGEV
ncbi:MAG: sodium-dependent transporter [Bacillota bacterium]|nr:sodium-dependent transporter [Bacillota bacterium]